MLVFVLLGPLFLKTIKKIYHLAKNITTETSILTILFASRGL